MKLAKIYLAKEWRFINETRIPFNYSWVPATLSAGYVLAAYFSPASLINKIGGFGIVLSILAAAILYYETFMPDAHCINLERQVLRFGSTKRVGITVTLMTITFVIVGLYNDWPHITRFAGHLVCNGFDDDMFMKALLSVMIAVIPAVPVYGFQKAAKIVSYRSSNALKALEEWDRPIYIKRAVRRVGFSMFAVGGMFQLLASLV